MRVAEQKAPSAPIVAPVHARWRILKAYFVTLLVLSSYLWVRIKGRYRLRPPTAAAFGPAMEAVHRRNARRIYRAIVELQGLYIKVGQLFSIMTNVLPEAFRTELAALQDQVPPRAYAAIEQRFRDEFAGRSPDQIFEHFERQPVASASIGQVHLARLPGGHQVAVKVQYPDIEQIVRADLVALRRIFSLLHRFVPHHGLDSVYEEIREMVLQELDFTAEARNVEAIAANFPARDQVRFPRVIRELTTSRILTTEYIEGVKVNDLHGLARLGVDRKQLARMVIDTYCQQIFHHGLYHADPHPGNILVSPGPTLHFLDFGAVAELSPRNREALVALVQGAINRDTNKIVGALRDMGFLAHHADPKVYDQVVEYFHERLHRELKFESLNLKDLRFDPDELFKNLADLRQMDISLADLTDTFRVPKEWIMLERTILLVMGLCTELDPELNPMQIIRPYVEDFVLGRDRDWSRFMLDTTRDIALSVISLPAEIRKLTSRASQGELEIAVAGQAQTTRVYYALGHQLIYTALIIAAGVGALHFYERQLERPLTIALGTGGFFALALLRSMWTTRRLLNRRSRRGR
jgi:predicted unusual protein kinase regulating ubiquinone biosynthesis (AarF/ABC1/UbiB family)